MSRQTEMWAVQYGRYGGPEVLKIGSAPQPKVGRKEVLVEVAGFSINQTDLAARQGKMKGLNGFGFPKGSGVDFAGTVVGIGSEVTSISVGEHVWGYIGMKPPGRAASAAQFVVIRADHIAAAPSRVTLGESAALPLVGLTALQTLRDLLKVTSGQRVLVVGGNGGIGSTAIQIAKILGADVDAVVGARVEVAKAAGADRTFNYHEGSPALIAERYDAILCTVATDIRIYRRLLRAKGRIATVTPAAIPAIVVSVITPGPMIRLVSASPNAADLKWLADHVDSSELAPVVDKQYSLEQVADAHRDFEDGPTGGKRIVTV